MVTRRNAPVVEIGVIKSEIRKMGKVHSMSLILDLSYEISLTPLHISLVSTVRGKRVLDWKIFAPLQFSATGNTHSSCRSTQVWDGYGVMRRKSPHTPRQMTLWQTSTPRCATFCVKSRLYSTALRTHL